MKKTLSYLNILLFVLLISPITLSASDVLEINGWSFSYETIGNNVTLTKVITSGDEKIVIPSTIDIDGDSYTITALQDDLFAGNETLKKITIPTTLISLDAAVSTQIPSSKPYADNPIILETAILPSDIWKLNATVNTGGLAANKWGTGLLASGSSPTADSYAGGFQFWVNNGNPASSGNYNGKLTLKYNGSTIINSDNALMLFGDTDDLSISLTFDGVSFYAKYTKIIDGIVTEEDKVVSASFAGFGQLSSALNSSDNFSNLEITTFTFNEAAGALSNVPNLTHISVNPGNPVYSSENGSLYDSTGSTLLIDLSEYNSDEKDPIQIGDWAFDYIIYGSELILTEVVSVGGNTLIIPESVTIDGIVYEITSIKNDLFAGNEILKRLSIPATLVSLSAAISSETPDPMISLSNTPITLQSPIEASDIWTLNATVNTGGSSFNVWGTALLATGENPTANDYTGGFQFWLNNGTVSGANSSGRFVFKTAGEATKHTFSDDILVTTASKENIVISILYKDGQYAVTISSGENTETALIEATSAGFSKLSTSIPATGSYSVFELVKYAFETTAGSLLNAPNLEYISVNVNNPVYSSDNGSLYDKTTGDLLVDLSEYNIVVEKILSLTNGWEFNYLSVGNSLILTKVVNSGTEYLDIPATVDIDNVTYTISSLAENLFKDNTVLSEISLPASIVSLGTIISTESPEVKPTNTTPITLASPIESSDVWVVTAKINTAGESANQWGTALLATGDVATLDDYSGGFQFWLNNGTAAGANSSGTLVYKYGLGATKYTFPETIKVPAGSIADITIRLAYDSGEYTAVVEANDNVESYVITPTQASNGFSQLSTTLSNAGKFNQLDITKLNYAKTASSLSDVPNLQYIYVSPENEVYSSVGGSLYTADNELLLDMSEYGIIEDDVLEINGWSFDYAFTGNGITLTKVIESGQADLVLPSSVTIGESSYNITSLEIDLFKGNTTIETIEIPATLTSLETRITTNILEEKPFANLPITLSKPVEANEAWIVNAVINTSGENANQWGTALLATGNVATLDNYSGGFQFWLNNGTASGDNSSGTIVYKYGNGAVKHIFPNTVKVLRGSRKDLGISLSYNESNYIATIKGSGNMERFSIATSACVGFSELSSTLTSNAVIPNLELSRLSFSNGAGSLAEIPNLESIVVDSENPVYSSIDGSLYDKSGDNILVDLRKADGIEDLEEKGILVYTRNGLIIVEGLQTNDVCKVYTITGVEVDYKTTYLPKGIYIVTINKKSYKIIL
ncbi:hypothetical protein LJB98_00600 [Bacteroidales bacterium OttesenSCG-928-M11]|nr:hypothetical protein [Bacteroidales bacterium OttesenSCG-928-M11]